MPDGGPAFPESLSADLLDFGYVVLALALELREANIERPQANRFVTEDAFEVAAEAIESAVRRGNPGDGDQGRHLVVAAAACHLAGFAARSFSLLPTAVLEKNLASSERALALLLRRDLLSLRELIVEWLARDDHSDDAATARLEDEDDAFDADDAILLALTTTYFRALGLADTALFTGDPERFKDAVEALRRLILGAAAVGNIPAWWVATLTIHLLRDLWEQSIHNQLPAGPGGDLPEKWSSLCRDFITQLAVRRPPHIDLWPSQLEAARRSVDPNDDLVIALPTSAGKTKIAELCILRALADEKRIIYITPLRALSAQVERVLAYVRSARRGSHLALRRYRRIFSRSKDACGCQYRCCHPRETRLCAPPGPARPQRRWPDRVRRRPHDRPGKPQDSVRSADSAPASSRGCG